ncbi:MAG: hypothetical protein ACXVBE_16680 [Bdellovibrionota bacterium]
MFALIPALLLVTLPLADNHDLSARRWSCMASGVDRDGQNHTVAGPFRSSKSTAKDAALRECRNEGLLSCGASFCTQESLPAEL